MNKNWKIKIVITVFFVSNNPEKQRCERAPPSVGAKNTSTIDFNAAINLQLEREM